MTAAPAQSVPLRPPATRLLGPRLVTLLLLVLVAALGASMLAASELPRTTLDAALLRVAGSESGKGAYTEQLLSDIGNRLRLAGGGLLLLVVGLLVLRDALQDLVLGAWLDLRSLELARPRGWAVRDVASLGVLTVLAAGVRAAFLGQPMRYDEAFSYTEFASRPLPYALSFYPDPNNHLLNTLLVHLTTGTLGDQPWVIRLPAYVAGVLLVPATYWLGRALDGRATGLLAAGLVGVSSYLVEYSTNARGYTLLALSFLLAFGLLGVAVRRSSRSALLLVVVIGALGAYAVSTMLYAVAVVGAWLGVVAWRRGRGGLTARHVAASVLLLGLLVGILYLPVVLVSGPDSLLPSRYVTPLGPGDLLRDLPRSLAQTWALWNRDAPLPIAALLVIGFVKASSDDLRQHRLPLGVLAFGVCLVMVLLQRVAPPERVWLFLLPLYLVLAAAGLVRLARGRVPAWASLAAGALGVGWLGLSVLSGGSILASPETGAFPDAAAVTQTLAGRLGADDAVLTDVPASLPQLQYYFARAHLPVQTLVRPPAEAQHVYVVAPAGTEPAVAGFGGASEVGRFSGSALYLLQRA